jgi:hypothetical protein
VLEKRTPPSLTSPPKPYPSVSVLASGNRRKWVEIRVRAPAWSVCLKSLKRDLMETVELLTPNKLEALCEVDWPAFGVG